MKSAFNCFVILLFTTLSMQSQINLKLKLIDEHNKPIRAAILTHANTNYLTDELGHAKIDGYFFGNKIKIRKLSFRDTSISIASKINNSDTIALTIVLHSKIIFLDEIPVYSNTVEEINPLNFTFILAYELVDDVILELLSGDNLVVLDANNQVKVRAKYKLGSNDLVKDPFGNINLLTNKYAHQLYLENNRLTIDTAKINIVKLTTSIKYCDAAFDTSIFVKRYTDNNQTVAFYASSITKNKCSKLLKVITDEDKRKAVQNYAVRANGLAMAMRNYDPENAAGVMGEIDYKEVDIYRLSEQMVNTLQMNYALPSYNVLKFINDTVYLFAHDLDTLFVYDKKWTLIKTKKIDYHRLKMWDKNIIVNEERNTAYAKFIKSGKHMIAEIDLKTGQLLLPFFTIEAHFPKNIKIRNNIVYFMTKNKNGVGYTVYSQKLKL